MVAPLIAAKAYAAAQGIAGDRARRRRPPAAGPDFGQLVTPAINQVVTNSKCGRDARDHRQRAGQGKLIDVVTALVVGPDQPQRHGRGAQPDDPVVPAIS